MVIAKVDCDKHGGLGTRFHITKYPTLKYVRNGQLAKREYRGQRSADKFVEFVEQQTKDQVKEYLDLSELQGIVQKVLEFHIVSDSIVCYNLDEHPETVFFLYCKVT